MSKIIKNIEYSYYLNSKNREIPLLFDLFIPEIPIPLDGFPLILFLHSGFFVTGCKEEMHFLCEEFSNLGYASVSINYRLMEKYSTDKNDYINAANNALNDLRNSIKFFIEKNHLNNIPPINSNSIFICGYSAGAIIALKTVLEDYLTNEKIYNGLSLIANIKGIISVSGAIPFNKINFNIHYPPILLIHGNKDEIVPFEDGFIRDINNINIMEASGSKTIFNKINKTNKLHQLVEIINGNHSSPFDMDYKNHSIQKINDFIKIIIKEHKEKYVSITL